MATLKTGPIAVNVAANPVRMAAGKSQPVASPRTGRPLGNNVMSNAKKGSMLMEIRPTDSNEQLAFGVPNTPPPDRKMLAKTFQDDNASVSSYSAPFSLANEEAARHEICMDSLAPWTYLLQIPGKNVRDVLIDSFNVWLQCKPDQLAVIKQVVGYLHTASLIIDDIEDESETRRGEPSAHMVYGIAPSLNAGNYVYFLALEKLLLLQSTECVQVFTGEMLNLHRGQGRDIFWRTTSYIASEEEYRKMVCDKTGGLFRLAIRIMQTLSSNAEERMLKKLSFNSLLDDTPLSSPQSRTTLKSTSSFIFTQNSDFTVLADQLACFFQVRDDLINLASPKFHEKKGYCEDITEGKLSFIALHALRTYRDSGRKKEMDRLLNLLQSKATDKKTIKEALQLMENTASFQHTLTYLRKLLVEIKESISMLGDNKMLVSLVDTLAKDLDDCNDVKKRVIDV